MTRLFGHRGLHHTAPENSLAAFRAARALGLDGVELDVRASADGVLFVHHDPDLAGRALIHTPAADLGALARLDEALGACGDLEVNVEVKMDAYGAQDPARARLLKAVVEVVGASGAHASYSSFDRSACRALVGLAPASAVGWLLDEGEDLAGAILSAHEEGFAAVHPHFRDVDVRLVVAAHAAGLAVNVWTPNEESELVAMILARVDAIITDEPERARLLLGKA